MNSIYIFSSLIFSALMLVSLVWGLGLMVSKKIIFDSEKMSPFECGFTPKFNSRLPFSMRFFLVALIFLVFDVELILMFPFIFSLCSGVSYLVLFMLFIFLVILILGLVHEWNQGSLDWAV